MKKYIVMFFFIVAAASSAHAWYDETHLAIAMAAGYKKWYNATAPDVARVKLGKIEGHNHYHNSPRGTLITAEMVLSQAGKYDTIDPDGHLYGAIIGSFRAYLRAKASGRYAENLLAYTVHYIGDLSMPLHHTMYNNFNRKYHQANDGVVEDEVLRNANRIQIYEITIKSETDLAQEVARVANIAKQLGHRLEEQNRVMTREEAYRQLGHSASLLKGILAYAKD